MGNMEKLAFLAKRIKEKSKDFGIPLRTLTELQNKIEKARYLGMGHTECYSLIAFVHGTCFGLGFLSHQEHENLSR